MKSMNEFGRFVKSNKKLGSFRVCQFCSKITDSKVKPFESIPGPKSLPIIGTLYKYLPVIGEYSLKELHKNGAKKYARYGPLVHEEIVKGEHIVYVFNPEDIAEVFKADHGKYPERLSHSALLKYRKSRPNVYNTGGLLPTNGKEWWRLRKEFQKDLSKPKVIVNYIPDTDALVKKFVKIREKSDAEDTMPLLSRLFLELNCLVAIDLKIDAFTDGEMKSTESMSSKLIDAAYTINSVLLRLDLGPKLWKSVNTPLYKQLCKANKFMEQIAIERVNAKIEEMKNVAESNDKASLLEMYLKNPNLDKRDVIGMACDMLLAGVDTTTYSSCFALYHLAKNPKAQEKLHEEATRLIANRDDAITAQTLEKANYTKAVLKETLRLNPISVGVGRLLQTDLILSGYRVRKGTNVVTQNQISCRLPEYFDEPDAFIPERWMRESAYKSEKPVHPYLVLPFGHGPRACIARRLAEQHMQILLLRICRELRFDWQGQELGFKTLPINVPDSPVKLKFFNRS